MRSSTKYLGLDVHQATTVTTVREASGNIIARSILPTEEAALLEFIAGMRGTVHLAFEEGTQAQWLHDLLVKRVARVVVCDQRGTPQRGNKGDHADSAQLSELLRTGQLRAVYHGRADRQVLKELTRSYEAAAPGSALCTRGRRGHRGSTCMAASSLPPGSRKWNRRPPGKPKIGLVTAAPAAVTAASVASKSATAITGRGAWVASCGSAWRPMSTSPVRVQA